jgi:hypothetical protein
MLQKAGFDKNMKSEHNHEGEGAANNTMTIDEVLNEFALQNEDHIREFAYTVIGQPKRQSVDVNGMRNQGVAAVIDKTFSKLERENYLTKT